MNIKYLKIDLINPCKIHKKAEIIRSNKHHHHNNKIDNKVHPFKATSPRPLQRASIFIKEKWEILIQSQMVIFATEWILPSFSPHLHYPTTSFVSEFGEKLALLCPIELSRLFPNLHKIVIHWLFVTKIHLSQLVRMLSYIGEVGGSNPNPTLLSTKSDF